MLMKYYKDNIMYILRLFEREKKRLIILGINLILISGASFVLPFMTKQLIDAGFIKKQVTLIAIYSVSILVIYIISSLLSVILTSISLSSSRRLIAASPVLRIFSYSKTDVFFTIPFFVAMNRYLSFS